MPGRARFMMARLAVDLARAISRYAETPLRFVDWKMGKTLFIRTRRKAGGAWAGKVGVRKRGHKRGHCAKINTDREETKYREKTQNGKTRGVETLRRSPAGKNPDRKERGATQPEASHA